MTDGNNVPNYGVTPEMLDELQEQRVAAIIRQKEEQEAQEMWPQNVNATLRALADKIAEQEARLALLEIGRG